MKCKCGGNRWRTVNKVFAKCRACGKVVPGHELAQKVLAWRRGERAKPIEMKCIA